MTRESAFRCIKYLGRITKEKRITSSDLKISLYRENRHFYGQHIANEREIFRKKINDNYNDFSR